MSCKHQAALAAAFFLAACGGGGGDSAPPPGPITPAEALRLTGQAVLDVTELAWALSFAVQNTVVTSPLQTVGTVDCTGGGRRAVTQPSAGLLRVEYQACGVGGVTYSGREEADSVLVSTVPSGTEWSGVARYADFSAIGSGGRTTMTAVAVGSGLVGSTVATGQALSMRLSGLSARRTPDALGRGALLTSTFLKVERIPDASARDLYALEGCVTIAASGVAAELCIDAGSRIGLLENVGAEVLTGRLRWNAGTPGGFDAPLRIAPGGAAGSTRLRIELDLDSSGIPETIATLDRTTDLGLRL